MMRPICCLENLKGGSTIHRLEQSWRWAAGAILAAGGAVYVFVIYGIPLMALWLAEHTPLRRTL